MALRLGTVAEFDDDRGTGTITATDGPSYFFHCTAIADGSRTIDPGAPVQFRVVPGHLGQWEATDVEVIRPPN
jgi:cold shock CspA family protein